MLNLRRLKTRFDFKAFIKGLAYNLLKGLIFLLIFLIVVPFNLLRIINSFYSAKVYDSVESIPSARVAIVFGAGLSPDGTAPSGVLQDRILSAIELYKAGKIQKIIMSGDNSFKNYNEPLVMLKFARDNGVSSFDLQADYAGRRTYDTCYRAKYIFGVEKAILVTQDFHLNRALYICNNLGIEATGYIANKSNYINEDYFAMRDFAATLLAYWELYVVPPQVILGEKINF